MQTKPCHQKPEVTSDPKPNSTSDLPLTSDTADLSLTSDPVTYDPDFPVTSDPDLPVISDPDNNLPFTSDPDLPDPHVPTHPLEAIKRSLCLPSQSWMIQKGNPDIKLQIYKVTSTPSTSKQPLVVTHCLTISDDLSWSLFVHNQELTSVKCPLLFGIPDRLTSESATSFLKVLDKLKVYALDNPISNLWTLSNPKRVVCLRIIKVRLFHMLMIMPRSPLMEYRIIEQYGHQSVKSLFEMENVMLARSIDLLLE